ncbi:MAG: hypothetical protein KGZ44_01970 [Dethiobacter sp.]|jgi:hypothetical protein|nr:hypothetical protein [Dethiobacter sp.]
MKKFLSLLIAISMILTMVVPVWGVSYRDTALAHLVERYGVPVENIEIFEGDTLRLEKIGQSFWSAKYAIYPNGIVPPPTTASPSTETKPLEVAPDTAVSDRPILIEPAQPADDGTIYGIIYIDEKTSTIVAEKEMAQLFERDRQLMEAEWEQLRREAGKLDVSLYQKLKSVAAGEKVKVVLLPKFTATSALEQQYNALKEKYPEFTDGLPELSQLFSGYGSAVSAAPFYMPEPMIEPALPENGSGSSSSTGSAIVIPNETPPVKIEGGQSEPGSPGTDTPSTDPSDRDIKDEVTDEYWQRHTAFQEELEAIRLAGIATSLATISEKLDTLGISYTATPQQILVEMTAAQINEIAALAEVENIYEDGIFATMDSLYRGSAQEETAATPLVADKSASGSTSSALWYLLLIPALIAGFAILKRIRAQA